MLPGLSYYYYCAPQPQALVSPCRLITHAHPGAPTHLVSRLLSKTIWRVSCIRHTQCQETLNYPQLGQLPASQLQLTRQLWIASHSQSHTRNPRTDPAVQAQACPSTKPPRWLQTLDPQIKALNSPEHQARADTPQLWAHLLAQATDSVPGQPPKPHLPLQFLYAFAVEDSNLRSNTRSINSNVHLYWSCKPKFQKAPEI